MIFPHRPNIVSWITASILLLGLNFAVYSQSTGEIDYPYLGIKFTIPEGWKGQELEEGYIMGSDTEAGFIFLMTHESKNLEQLNAEARQGIYEEGGTQLQLNGELEPVGNAGVGGMFTGMLEYSQAQAYIVAVINPFGTGVTVMAITDPQHYSERYESLAKEVAKNLKFALPKEIPVVKEWEQTLKGAKLTYMSSSSSSGYSSYGYSSTTEEILLCSNGQFTYYYNSSISAGSSGVSGYSDNNDNGQGTWSVIGDGAEGAILQLDYNDGRQNQFQITYSEEKTYLNDSRYFRTYDHGECY